MAPVLALPSLSLFDEIAKYAIKHVADGRDKTGDTRLTFLQVPHLQVELPQLDKIHAFPRNLEADDPALTNRLGQGAFGTVYRAGWSFPRTVGGVTDEVSLDVAVKVLKENERLSVQDFVREAHLWVRVPPHPNVLPLVGIYFRETDRLRGLVSPLATGVLSSWLSRQRTYRQRFKMVCDIAEGLKHLHENGIVHGDLSWGNVFIVENTAVVADFGLSLLEVYRAEDPHARLISEPTRHLPARWTKALDVCNFGNLTETIMTHNAAPFDTILNDHGLRVLWELFKIINPQAHDHPADGAAIVERIRGLPAIPASAGQ